MNTKTVPFTAEQLENIIAQYPTPFHIYDEEGIIENMKSFINAFSWNKGFKQYFAVKATPNPYIMRVLQKLGVGADCSSLAELLLCEKVGITGHDIMFTSNDTPYVEYKKALDMGVINDVQGVNSLAYSPIFNPMFSRSFSNLNGMVSRTNSGASSAIASSRRSSSSGGGGGFSSRSSGGGGSRGGGGGF